MHDVFKNSAWNKLTFDDICNFIIEGDSLTKICALDGMPSKGVFLGWCDRDKELADQYARAMELRTELYAEEIVNIADTCEDPTKARLQIDARKWVACKLKPKKYGDKITHEGNEDNPIIQKIVRETVDGNADNQNA